MLLPHVHYTGKVYQGVEMAWFASSMELGSSHVTRAVHEAHLMEFFPPRSNLVFATPATALSSMPFSTREMAM